MTDVALEEKNIGYWIGLDGKGRLDTQLLHLYFQIVHLWT